MNRRARVASAPSGPVLGATLAACGGGDEGGVVAGVTTTCLIGVPEQSEDAQTAQASVDLVLSVEGRQVLADVGVGSP